MVKSTSLPDDLLVKLEHTGFCSAGRWLVRGVDLQLKRGEIVTLIGPNGSGKSTTAKLALGVLLPDEGRVFRQKGLKIGYVPQRFHVDWTLPLTVGRLMGLTARLSDSEIEDALAHTGISHLQQSALQTLSGGELQRALLARALARKPDLLVLDEPVQGVDFSGELALYRLIGDIPKSLGCGILLISHDLHIVMAATDRVICLNGHVCCAGPPTLVAENPAYRKLFGHRASAALAVYEHHHAHLPLPEGEKCGQPSAREGTQKTKVSNAG